MATFNAASSTNNVNQVLYSWQTKHEFRTDRPAGTIALHGIVKAIENLGVGVAQGDPFTLLQ